MSTSEYCCGVRFRTSTTLSGEDRTERGASQSVVAMVREVRMTDGIRLRVGMLRSSVKKMKEV